MLKYIYLFVIIVYGIFIILFFFKIGFSYKIYDVNPNIIKERSLTETEYFNEKKAHALAQNISKWFMGYSFMVFLITSIIKYFHLLPADNFMKYIFYFSLIATLILFIAWNSNFIPMPPIR